MDTLIRSKIKGSFLLLVTAIIWGMAFVVQSSAMDSIGPFLLTNIRFFVGGLVLIPVSIFLAKRDIDEGEISLEKKHDLIIKSIKPGIRCGIFLCIASLLQQFGLLTTSAGKSAFITTLYIVFVPVAGIFLGKKINKLICFCIIIALAGLYLLCINKGFSIATGDILTLLCAVTFTAQIISIDLAMQEGADPVICAMVEFFTVSALSLIPTLIFESFDFGLIINAAPSILYTGVFSSAIGYTFQMIGQKEAGPILATHIMSLESVFATIAGALILHEFLSLKEISGCLLVFIAVITVQLSSLLSRS